AGLPPRATGFDSPAGALSAPPPSPASRSSAARRPLRRRGARLPRFTGPPTLPRRPSLRAAPNHPGGPERVLVSVASPSHLGLPRPKSGSASTTSVRGLLRIHSRWQRGPEVLKLATPV